MNVNTIVTVSAILLGFMLAFFNKWLFLDSNNKKSDNNEDNTLSGLEYLVTYTGLFSVLFFAITIIVGLFSGNITQNCLHIFMIIGVVFLFITVFLATICEIKYIEDNKKQNKSKEDKENKELFKELEKLLNKKLISEKQFHKKIIEIVNEM